MQVMSSRANYKIERKKNNKTQTYTVYRDLIVTYKIKIKRKQKWEKYKLSMKKMLNQRKNVTRRNKNVSVFPAKMC